MTSARSKTVMVHCSTANSYQYTGSLQRAQDTRMRKTTNRYFHVLVRFDNNAENECSQLHVRFDNNTENENFQVLVPLTSEKELPPKAPLGATADFSRWTGIPHNARSKAEDSCTLQDLRPTQRLTHQPQTICHNLLTTMQRHCADKIPPFCSDELLSRRHDANMPPIIYETEQFILEHAKIAVQVMPATTTAVGIQNCPATSPAHFFPRERFQRVVFQSTRRRAHIVGEQVLAEDGPIRDG
jgi:hypothetical protein